jgi:hypothetical protein
MEQRKYFLYKNTKEKERRKKKRKATPILAKAYERNIAERKIRQKDH